MPNRTGRSGEQLSPAESIMARRRERRQEASQSERREAATPTIGRNVNPNAFTYSGDDFWRTWQASRRERSDASEMAMTPPSEPVIWMDEMSVQMAEANAGITNLGEAEDATYALEAASSMPTQVVTEQEEMGFPAPPGAHWADISPAEHPYQWDEEGAPIEEQATRPIETPPEDPMEPHESDTVAITHFRNMIENHYSGSGILNANIFSDYNNLLTTLTRNARQVWVENGGSNTAPNQSRPWEPPSEFGRSRRESRPSSRFGSSSRPEPVASGQTFFGNIPETSTMTTVASNFGMRVNYPSIEKHPLIVGTHLAGVEIELENLAIDHPSFRYWTAKSDGSLRNHGMEFVCSHPWGGVDLYNAAVEIDGFLFGNNPEDTWRCSTHVHIDVRDMTAAQVKKMILAYVFFERVLFKCSGWHRYKNNFCVALGFAQGQLEDLGNWWADSDAVFLNNLTGRWDKYTAINFLPMSHFGSIEFRLGEAKWHKGQLIRLTNRFLSLKEVAMANSELTDEAFVEMLSQASPADIIRKGIPKGLGNIQEDLEVGFKLCHDILSLAKLRRRNKRVMRPNLEDGSRIVVQPRGDFFSNGYSHMVTHLTHHNPNLEFPGTRDLRDSDGNYNWTFAYLYEVQQMMRRISTTFEIQWFLPQQNRAQLQSLYDRYVRERRAAEQGEASPEEAPRARRRSEPVPNPFDEVEEDDEPEEDVEW